MIDRLPIGVVGLGTMGAGIAQVFAAAGHPVIATDANPMMRDVFLSTVKTGLASRAAAGKLKPEEAAFILSHLTFTDDLAEFSHCALVVEAIVENRDAKRQLFASLEDIVSANAILATNTSSIPVHEIAGGLSRPERCLALHFFNPPTAMKLVELARHTGTSDAAAALARQLVEGCNKVVVACPDRPGFIVNRCARPFYGEALALLSEGRSASDIDASLLAYGYRMGPFSLIDLVGADVNLAATAGLYAAMGEHPRYFPFPSLKRQVDAGRLGRKSGHGFIHPDKPGPAPSDAKFIALRIEAMLVNEAHWFLDEGGISRADIDTAMRLGLNFPRGPFEILAQHGRPAILEQLSRLRESAPAYLKNRYLPARSLEQA